MSCDTETPGFAHEFIMCPRCRIRQLITTQLYYVEELKRTIKLQVLCSTCRARSFALENFVTTEDVSDELLQQVLRLGPTKVQVDKNRAVRKGEAPKELQWTVNTKIDVIFFFRDGTSVGATKQLALYTYINDAPRVVGVLERSRGTDIYKPSKWYQLFNAENADLMHRLAQEEDCEADDAE